MLSASVGALFGGLSETRYLVLNLQEPGIATIDIVYRFK